MRLDTSGVLGVLAESDRNYSAPETAFYLCVLALVGFILLRAWVWNSCAWRCRRLAIRERAWFHSYRDVTTADEDKHGWDHLKCVRCGYDHWIDRAA